MRGGPEPPVQSAPVREKSFAVTETVPSAYVLSQVLPRGYNGSNEENASEGKP